VNAAKQKYVRVKNKFTNEQFWINKSDAKFIGKNKKVEVFNIGELPKPVGCQPFKEGNVAGFMCYRSNTAPVKGRKFMGDSLEFVRQKVIKAFKPYLIGEE